MTVLLAYLLFFAQLVYGHGSSTPQTASPAGGLSTALMAMAGLMYVGFLNIQGLQNKVDRLKTVLAKHHGFGFAETFISKERRKSLTRNFIPDFKTYFNSYHSTHTKGVALCIRENIQVLQHSEAWDLPEALQGRFIAVQIMLPSDDTHHSAGFKIWITSCYAPTNTTNSEIRAFYAALRVAINQQMNDELQYHLGDWNGCLRTDEDQLKIPFAPVHSHDGDRALHNFFHEQQLMYPIDRMASTFDVGEVYLHKTIYSEKDSGKLITYLSN